MHPGCGSPGTQIERLKEEAVKLAKSHALDAPTSHLKGVACGLVAAAVCLAF